jgi:hypothetical protein
MTVREARVVSAIPTVRDDDEDGPDARRREATTEAWAAHAAGRSDEPTKQMGRHRRRVTA